MDQFSEDYVLKTAVRLFGSRVSDTTYSRTTIKFWGRVFSRIPFGSESHGFRFLADIESGECHDCGKSVGEIHEAYCDAEECPRCHTQLLSCFCGLRLRAETLLRSHQKARESRASGDTTKRRRAWKLSLPSQIDFLDDQSGK